MHRRELIRWMIGLAAGAAMPIGLAAHERNATRPDWWLGFRGIGRDELITPRLATHGRIPDNLRGRFYRNGPGRHRLGNQRYGHWFDGDGLVQAFTFSDKGVAHRARFVQTPKYVAETKAGRFLRPAYGSVFPDMDPIEEADDMNVANTHIVPVGDKLLALWEAGSAWAVDPENLDTLDTISWSEDLQGAPFSAHPRVETDGRIWNFGVANTAGILVLYDISPNGSLNRAATIPLGASPMIHDFAVTENHLLFLMPPFRLDVERFADGTSFVDSHRWYPDEALEVMVVSKSTLSVTRVFELPTGFVFHLGNAWEDRQGTIRFDYARYDDPRVTTAGARGFMRGQDIEYPRSRTAVVKLDMKTGKADQEVWTEQTEFPKVSPYDVGQRYRYLYTMGRSTSIRHPLFNTVYRQNMESGHRDAYVYGPDVMAEEHIFVPKPGGDSSDGWLVGTALDLVKEITVLSVFEADRLADGPIASADLPYALPLGLHGSFLMGGV